MPFGSGAVLQLRLKTTVASNFFDERNCYCLGLLLLLLPLMSALLLHYLDCGFLLLPPAASLPACDTARCLFCELSESDTVPSDIHQVRTSGSVLVPSRRPGVRSETPVKISFVAT